ncbi:hypothetical protein [Levilactobacillus sp. N40-8-2]|uniref:hypothetical protein n=1 Tax=Levilactobacillus muriae TaxID=3238987 RepID=UPI0038B255E1
MKTSELKNALRNMGIMEQIRKRQNELWINAYDPFGNFLASTSVGTSGRIETYSSILGIPLSDQRQLIGYMMDYAQTPIEQRSDEKRWNVVIGQDGNRNGLTVWAKGSMRPYYTSSTTDIAELSNFQNVFTDSEFNELIEHLKKLPHGDTYAKIAELGKREVDE